MHDTPIDAGFLHSEGHLGIQIIKLHSKTNNSNTDYSFYRGSSNCFFSPWEMYSIAQENKNIGDISETVSCLITKLYVVCTH